MRRLTLCLTAACLSASVTAQVPRGTETLDPNERVIILFDRSGSMRQDLDGVPKIELARGFFDDLGKQIVGRSNVSVRFFANGEGRDREDSCQAGVAALTFGSVATQSDVDAMVASVSATGRTTNIDHALRAARSDLRAAGGGRILLISDGLETCDGDPAALAETMGDMPIDVIAMGDGADLAPLADIALNSGGNFTLADSPAAFAAATNASLPGFSMPQLPETPPASADQLVQIIEVDNGVDSCSAFDVVQQRIIEVTRGSVSLTSETVDPGSDAPIATEFILDASGSMAGRAGDQVKMHVALAAFESAVAELEGTKTLSALRAYGFDASLEWTEAASCPNTELLTSFSSGDATQMIAAARALTPYGYTPIAASLEGAADDLMAVDARERLIVLITDGEETCDGDPVAVAARLAKMGVNLSTYVVGFDLEPEQAEQMRAVAEAGGGRYLDAPDANSLRETLREVVGVTVRKAEREVQRCDNPVQGGLTAADAVPLEPGLYTVGELIPKGEYRYYRVDTQPGELGVVRSLLQSRRYIDGGAGPTESTAGAAAMTIQILTPEGERAGSGWPRVMGLPGESAVAYFADTEGRGFVIGLGDNYDRVAPESLIEVSIEAVPDGASGDAPADLGGITYPRLSVNSVARGYFGYDDLADIWRAETAGPAEVSVTPQVDDMRYRIEVYAEGAGARLARKIVTGRATVTVAAEGPILVRIETREPRLAPKFTAYDIGVKSQP